MNSKQRTINSEKQQVLILLGPPGAGKGTQATLLSEKLNLYYLETAKIGEKKLKYAKNNVFIEIEGKKYYFEREKKLWKEGKLWDPPFAVYLIKEKIESLAKEKKGIVLAGSPRTLYEGKRIIPLLEKLYGRPNIKIFHLDLSIEQSIWRNSHRRICKLMRHPILYNKETIRLTKCPLDGSKLIKRALDKPAIIKKRFKVYEKQTLPLLDFFKKKNFTISKINGEQSVVDVFNDILKSIKR